MMTTTMKASIALAMAFGFVTAFAAPPVKVAIESVPSEATVTVAGQSCTTPCQLEVPKGPQKFTAEKADFKNATVTEKVVRAGQVIKLELKYAIPYYKAGEGLTDTRNKKKYKTKILLSKDGNSQQEWMAENLNIVTKTSKCPGGNKQNCAKQGRLYSWADAMYLDPEMNTRDDAAQCVDSYRQGICPDGWRLPTEYDMQLALTLYRTHEWRPNGRKDLGFGGDMFWSGIAKNHMVFASNQFDREFKFDQRGAPDVEGKKVGDWYYDSDMGSIRSVPDMNFVRCVKAEAVVEGQKLDVMNQVLVRDGTTLTPTDNAPINAMKMVGWTNEGMRYERTFGSFVVIRKELPKFSDYATTKIGNQVWMARNLDVATEESYCYGNNPANCEKYGRLYTWKAAMKACPAGFHLPTSEEWDKLEKALGENAGKKLKSKEWGGSDSLGFNALPAGDRDGSGDFYNVGSNANFWTATEYDDNYAYYRYLRSDDTRLLSHDHDEDGAYSVRCIED